MGQDDAKDHGVTARLVEIRDLLQAILAALVTPPTTSGRDADAD
jgi:hypothetical protein